MKINADAVIVGTGVAGLFAALSLPRELEVVVITKADPESSDSFLAQGGICVLRDEEDYDSYFEDTMRAGHYENRRESVDIMIRGSRQVIRRLVGYGVEFERDGKVRGCPGKAGRGKDCHTGAIYHPGKRRHRREIPALHQFSPPDRRRH